MDSRNLFILHYGIKGQSWGKRRYQNADGSLTAQGRMHYGYGNGVPTTVTQNMKRGTKGQKAVDWRKIPTTVQQASKGSKSNRGSVYPLKKVASGSKTSKNISGSKNLRVSNIKTKAQVQSAVDPKDYAVKDKAALQTTNALKANEKNSNDMSKVTADKKKTADPYKTLPRDDVKGRVWINPTNGKVNDGLYMLANFESEEALLKHIKKMEPDGGLGLFMGENFGIGEDNWTDADYEKHKEELLEQYRDVQKTLEGMDMGWQEQLEMEAPGIFEGKNPDVAKSIAKNFTKTMESLGIDVSHMTKKQKILAKSIAASMAGATKYE